jgi:hypothetical protein
MFRVENIIPELILFNPPVPFRSQIQHVKNTPVPTTSLRTGFPTSCYSLHSEENSYSISIIDRALHRITDEFHVALASNKLLSAGVRSFVQTVIIYLPAILLRVKWKTSP